MTKQLIVLLLLSSFAVPSLAADSISLDPSSNPFAARPLGMGGVSVAFSDDANGIFSNPAGHDRLAFPQIIAASRKLVLDETQYTLLGWAVPTEWGNFGVGYTSMNTGGSLPTKIDPATQRIVIDPSREAMSYDNNVTAFSYSRKLREGLSLGGSLKLFNQFLSGAVSSRASSFGLDLAALYRPLPWLAAGADLQNVLGGDLRWEGGSGDKVGGFYKLGCKINVLGPTGEALSFHENKLYGGIDLGIPHSTNSPSFYGLGLEYFPQEKIALRAGFNSFGITLGVGVTNGGFRFDYAYAANSNIPGDSPHYFSLSYIGERVISFSRKLKRKEPDIRFSQPRDRLVTDRDSIDISAEARARRILEQKTTWTVTAISETHEVKEVSEPENLKPIYINGIKIEQVGSIETHSSLSLGRNVFRIDGFASAEVLAGKITAEVFTASAEAKVLRFAPFSDTPMDHWAIEPIALNVTLGLVKGYPGNTFRPEKGISRAELVTLLVRTLPVKLEDIPETTDFTDVSTQHWAIKYIAYGSSQKLVTGYPDKTFKPNNILTRAEGVTLLARYAGLAEDANAALPFPDLKADFWANKSIAPAKAAGLLKYLEGKNFDPSAPFTRAEACEVLYRVPAIQKRVNEFWETGVISATQ